MKYFFKKLESYLLLESRIDQVKKYLSPIGDEDLQAFVDIDPTPQKKYIVGLAKLFDGKPHVVTFLLNNIAEYLIHFDRLANKGLIKQKNIEAYDSWDELKSVINKAKNEEESKKAEKQAKKDKIVIYEKKDDPWYLIQPKSHKASEIYGYNTKWCISAKDDPQHWDSYTRQGIKFVFIINRQTNDKWCVAYHAQLKKKLVEVFDQLDEKLTMFDLKNVMPNYVFNIILNYIDMPNDIVKSIDRRGDTLYTLYGAFHREDGPAIIYRDGGEKWYKFGKLNREDGPAVIQKDGTESWWLDGMRHNENGPAIVFPSGTKKWYLNGQLHREDEPAVELSNGDKEWYLNGKLHREDGPAVEYAESHRLVKKWYQHGELHRIDGPAVINKYTEGENSVVFREYYLNGQQYRNEQEWQKAKEEMGLK